MSSLVEAVRRAVMDLRVAALEARGAGRFSVLPAATPYPQPPQPRQPQQSQQPQQPQVIQPRTPLLDLWRSGARPVREALTSLALAVSRGAQPQPEKETPKTVKCASCEAENPETARYCMACGADLRPRPAWKSPASVEV